MINVISEAKDAVSERRLTRPTTLVSATVALRNLVAPEWRGAAAHKHGGTGGSDERAFLGGRRSGSKVSKFLGV